MKNLPLKNRVFVSSEVVHDFWTINQYDMNYGNVGHCSVPFIALPKKKEAGTNRTKKTQGMLILAQLAWISSQQHNFNAQTCALEACTSMRKTTHDTSGPHRSVICKSYQILHQKITQKLGGGWTNYQSEKKIIKLDHFPGMKNKPLEPTPMGWKLRYIQGLLTIMSLKEEVWHW